jgi:hypothetical protein
MSKANDLARLLNASGELQAADIEDGVITSAKLASTLDLSGKTVTLPAGTGGKVLQVVQVTAPLGSEVTVSSSTLTQMYSTTFTPTSASSKVLVTFEGHTNVRTQTSGNPAGGLFAIYRNGSLIYDPNVIYPGADQNYFIYTQTTTMDSWFVMHLSYLDSPATTSAITYALYGANKGGGTSYVRSRGENWIFMEIAA